MNQITAAKMPLVKL